MPQPRRGRPTKPRELWLAKDPFLKALQDACHVAQQTGALPLTERQRQVEDSFFRAAVALEAFLSDWLARAVHFDTRLLQSAAVSTLQDHLIREAQGDWEPDNRVLARTISLYQPRVRLDLSIPTTVAVQRARELLGVVDTNRSFPSAADFKEWVGRYVADPCARQHASSLNAADDAVIDATLAIRNVLAHRSKHADDRLAETLAGAALPVDLRVQNATGGQVGRYLRVERNGRGRFMHYFLRLTDVANKLAPYRGRPRSICP